MSFISKIWTAIRNPVRCVGRDLQGNKYFEHPSSSDDPRRTKRTVQYHQADDMWKYIGGGQRLPVQWSAWLTHTRHHPPTLEELQADVERQQRVLANVAMIEARDREEHEQALRLRESMHAEALGAPKASQLPPAEGEPQRRDAEPDSEPPESQKPQATEQKQEPEESPKSPWKLNVDPEPESWSPRARRRG